MRTGYYPAVKKADAQAKLGVVVDTPNDTAWNDVVLRKAQPFDFVELHYYPEYNVDSDQELLGPAIDNFASDLTGLRKQMTAAGVSKNVPPGETWGGFPAKPQKQWLREIVAIKRLGARRTANDDSSGE